MSKFLIERDRKQMKHARKMRRWMRRAKKQGVSFNDYWVARLLGIAPRSASSQVSAAREGYSVRQGEL